MRADTTGLEALARKQVLELSRMETRQEMEKEKARNLQRLQIKQRLASAKRSRSSVAPASLEHSVSDVSVRPATASIVMVAANDSFNSEANTSVEDGDVAARGSYMDVQDTDA
jgi:hypothetical protein